MPVINAVIKRAWRMSDRADRIHYVVAKQEGGVRRLYVDQGHALYKVLDDYLLAQDYHGPKSGMVDPEETEPGESS